MSVRVGSCGFVDHLLVEEKSDPRSHTNQHEQTLV